MYITTYSILSGLTFAILLMCHKVDDNFVSEKSQLWRMWLIAMIICAALVPCVLFGVSK